MSGKREAEGSIGRGSRKRKTPRGNRVIKVDYLARVEGEGGLWVKVRDAKVVDTKFKIFEPPRFFEALLRGRDYREAPDITARICGICPIAYQMSAVHAMEDALGLKVDEPIRALRRLIYCGEWMESHGLHVFMLHAPDFLGYEDGIQMAKDHPEVVRRGLELKKRGNDIVALLGGREIHPINVRVGGFYRVPSKRDLKPLREKLLWAVEAAVESVRWMGGLPFPDLEQDYEFVSLRHPEEYPFNEGRLVSNRGLDIEARDFERSIEEEHVKHSTSLQARIRERGPYLVGPLARVNLNFDQLTPLAQEEAKRAGLTPICGNPFRSIIARGVEILWAAQEALRIVQEYEPPDAPFVEAEARNATGYGVTEAPRGSLYHRYRVDDRGLIQNALLVPPTSQNQKMIESDLRRFTEENLSLPEDELQWRCEQVIRNYDPCISCSCHFLRLVIDRG
jgi:sulfhydrogenase subunit alpha